MFEAAALLAAAWRKKKLRRNKWAVTPFFLFCCDIHSYFEISSCRKLLGQDEYLCVPKFRNRIRVGQFVPWETTSLCPPCCPLVVLGRNNLWRSVPVCFLMKHFRLEGGGGEFVHHRSSNRDTSELDQSQCGWRPRSAQNPRPVASSCSSSTWRSSRLEVTGRGKNQEPMAQPIPQSTGKKSQIGAKELS